MIEDTLKEILDRLDRIESQLNSSVVRGSGRPRESVTLALESLEIGKQLLLPFGPKTASNAHQRAARLGIKIVTQTVKKYGTEWTQLKRVA